MTLEIKTKIGKIWDDYISSNGIVRDTKGNIIADINDKRYVAIEEIKAIITKFLQDDFNIDQFKTALDSYNKRNNLWGFTATKGQMFFNQLTRSNDGNIAQLTTLLKQLIVAPASLDEAKEKIGTLETLTKGIFLKATDKRKVPNPNSTGYFLSYFWQIADPLKWPIIYTSLVSAFRELAIWEDHASQKESYRFFFHLNEEVKLVLKEHTKTNITNWDAEHAFWNFKGANAATQQKTIITTIPTVPVVELTNKENLIESSTSLIKADFEISDYLIPKVASLVALGSDTDKPGSVKGTQFEKLVAEIFKLLDFDVEMLGQGTGRNPDAIIRFREENTAFIVDAKAYSSGYSLGLDDRAIKEYINHHCPKLQREGYKKIGFIIVSNSFKSDLETFINNITWNTDVKRFILLTSEALLYLLAYKTKDRLGLSRIIESLISFGNLVTAKNVIEEFQDV